MKKRLILPLTIVSLVLLTAFSSQRNLKHRSTAKIWWDFTGTSFGEMGYNWYYVPDDNNWPDCPIQAGNIYCEIYAVEDPDSPPGEPRPDLTTISNQRMRL